MNTDENKSDERFRLMISNVLRFGVGLSAILILLGGFLFFSQSHNPVFDYTAFNNEPSNLKDIFLIVRDALSFEGKSVIQLGVLILIATPFLRVFFSLIGFAYEKDRVYVLITGIVLFILSCSLFG